jgi:glycosyltransferase involved in cell wall biosynthesis
MRVLTICLPMIGGLYGVVLGLRRSLQPHGVDLRWLAAGKSIAGQARESGTPADLATGALVADDTDDEMAKARALIDHISSTNPDVVIFHVLGGPLETNVARYLPPHIRRIVVAHNITPATYRAARSIRNWVHAAVGVSPRIASDLIRLYGFDPAWTCTIPNAVDLSAFPQSERPPSTPPRLHILSLGRVEHGAKGVLWLPEILDRATRTGANLTLTVAGDGPDLPRLKTETARRRLDGRVRFLGAVPRHAVPQLMAEHDVLLFPSIFEGFGLTLVEAMTAGCVPVASLIRGVTDAIVDDGKSGLLFPAGDRLCAAERLLWLYANPDALALMSRAAAAAATNRYSLDAHGAAYYELLRGVLDSPRPISPPLPVSAWAISSFLQPGWRRFVPAPAKHVLRLLRERL